MFLEQQKQPTTLYTTILFTILHVKMNAIYANGKEIALI